MYGVAVHFCFELLVKSTAFSSGVVGRGHRNPKGVQNIGTLENYKHCTPPE
jgi:hypothetical protein